MSSVTVIGGVQPDVVMSPVTELPPPGGTSLTAQMSIRVGGAGANAALAFVETGMEVRLLGAVGDDMLGRWIREQLASLGVADELLVLAHQSTGLTVALESPERDRTFLTYLGVNEAWSADTIPADALESENLLLCDYFVTPQLQGAAARALLSGAREHGARTFFDTAWDPDDFSPLTRAEVAEILPCVDVFLPNEAEACALAGVDAVDAATRTLQSLSGGWVVVKLGPRGCLAAGPDGRWLTAAAPAVSVADTTGAGDAFNAGLVNALSTGLEWPDALRAATEFASRIISRPSHERHRPRAER